MSALVTRLVGHRRGNAMMIAAFALIPLTFATGMVIDYSRAGRLQTKLNAAADAAALSATTSPMLGQSVLAACNAARRTFLNALEQGSGGLVFNSAVNPTVTITETYSVGVPVTVTCPYLDASVPKVATLPASRTATVSYAAKSSNAFAGILGAATIDIGGTATASGSPLTYLDYYIIIDISQSMGIASTATDMQALFNRTKTYNGTSRGCVFGCHVKGPGDTYANEYLAHNISPRIELRIDSAVAAVKTIINDAKAASGTDKNIRIGIYTMSDDPTNSVRFTKVSAPSSDYDTLLTTLDAITLGGNTASGLGDTTFDYAMGQLNNQLPATNGTGLTQSSPQNYVFVVSDGIRDQNIPGTCYYGHCMGYFDSALCTPLKAKATVGTIYTTYLPIYRNNDPAQGLDSDYVGTAKPYVPYVAPAMQACASSSSLYYEASDGPAIDAAMKSLFASTLQLSRLTQ